MTCCFRNRNCGGIDLLDHFCACLAVYTNFVNLCVNFQTLHFIKYFNHHFFLIFPIVANLTLKYVLYIYFPSNPFLASNIEHQQLNVFLFSLFFSLAVQVVFFLFNQTLFLEKFPHFCVLFLRSSSLPSVVIELLLYL